MLYNDHVKRLALEVGFDDCGIARADRLSDDEYPLRQWLARGWNADLGYMERNVDMRLDPRLLVPGAQSVICLVSAYPPPAPPSPPSSWSLKKNIEKKMFFCPNKTFRWGGGEERGGWGGAL